MNTFFNFSIQKAWLGLLSVVVFAVVLGMFAGTANAAPSASFSATASGGTANLTLSVTANIADADVGLSGRYYLGFKHNNVWYFHNGSSWAQYSGGTRPAYSVRALASGTAQVVRNMNLTSRVGGQLYAGYGLSESDMLTNGKYALVYTVTAESMTLGPAPVLLGSAGNFAVLAKTAVSTVPPSVIVGNVGVSPAATSFLTGFSLTAVGTTSATSPQVTGVLYGGDMTPPTNTTLTTAVLDMQAAYTDAAGRPTPDSLNLGGGDIGGKNLPAGLYKWGSSVTIPANLGISGGANDVWIFQISGDLIVSAGKRITLADGAQAKNIFWQVAGQVIVGAGAHLEGNILSQTAITMQTGATLNGRALAQSMVALDSATVIKPAL
jgi:hypothetical protein